MYTVVRFEHFAQERLNQFFKKLLKIDSVRRQDIVNFMTSQPK